MKRSRLQQNLIERDSRLVPVMDAVGPRPRWYRNDDPYYALMSAIAAQQLSGKAADTIFNRFLDLCPGRYPEPHAVLSLSPEVMRGAGLSRQKAGYMRNIAAFAAAEGIHHDILDPMTDDEVLAYLTRIKGVGRWTVEMLLLFSLDRPDVFPVDDLGIRQAMTDLYRLRSRGRALSKRMTAIAEAWRPHRSYVVKCLWRWK